MPFRRDIVLTRLLLFQAFREPLPAAAFCHVVKDRLDFSLTAPAFWLVSVQ